MLAFTLPRNDNTITKLASLVVSMVKIMGSSVPGGGCDAPTKPILAANIMHIL